MTPAETSEAGTRSRLRRRVTAFLCLALTIPFAAGNGQRTKPGPPLHVDHDTRPIEKPGKEREVSELYAILYNSLARHLSPQTFASHHADQGALNVNAWDEVPDSSWFTNRIGRRSLTFEEILAGLEGRPPASGEWVIRRVRDEGYTPKVDIQDTAGGAYILKFDLPSTLERNSGAERICTLIMHAAGYNVPHNSIVYFHAEALKLDDNSYYRDALKRRRPLTQADLKDMLAKLNLLPDGRYRGLASLNVPGITVGPFVYVGRRKDDPNDLIPHQMRRELRGLRVLASWINHVDVKDANAMDAYDPQTKYIRHYLLDFGSAFGGGDFINGPYRIGHEYIYDGAAMARSFFTLGIWQRPWDTQGKILYPQVGYFQAELFEPGKWKPNYPNLAFEEMDDSDAYWGAKIVTAFSGETIRKLAEAGEYSLPEVARHIEQVLLKRRDAVGRYWFGRITPLEEFRLSFSDERRTLGFRDLAVERGYVDASPRSYHLRVKSLKGRDLCPGSTLQASGGALTLPKFTFPDRASQPPDRFGRIPLVRLLIASERSGGGLAKPVEVFLGYQRTSGPATVLGWSHAPQ